VSAGAVTATVPGAFGSSFQVKVTPSWLADSWTITKALNSFTVLFMVPAPTNGSFDYIVSPIPP